MSRHLRQASPQLLRIKWSAMNRSDSYQKEQIQINRELDSRNSDEYLTIRVNDKIVIDERLRSFQWLADSSSNGIAAFQYRDAAIVMRYDHRNSNERTFFQDLERALDNEDRSRPGPAERNWTTTDLIGAIQRGSQKDAEQAATFLAKSRARVPLQLFNEEKQAEKSVTSNSLELKLRIEYQNCDRPVTKTIFVPKNTNLGSLKTQVAQEARINIGDQFWFAGEQHLIPDEYEFGSGKPVSKLLRGNPPSVKSGDTLILYIASTPSMKC